MSEAGDDKSRVLACDHVTSDGDVIDRSNRWWRRVTSFMPAR